MRQQAQLTRVLFPSWPWEDCPHSLPSCMCLYFSCAEHNEHSVVPFNNEQCGRAADLLDLCRSSNLLTMVARMRELLAIRRRVRALIRATYRAETEGVSQFWRHAGLNPLDVVAKVRELLAKLAVVEGPDALSREAQRNATLLFFAHARATLASKRVLREHRLSAEALDYVIGEIEARFHKACRLSSRAQCTCLGAVELVLSQDHLHIAPSDKRGAFLTSPSVEHD